MKILFVVHAEKMFAEIFPGDFQVKLCKEVYGGGYDEIILLDSCIGDGVLECVDSNEFTRWYWSWGYEPSMFEDDELEWVIEGSPAHEWTWVPPEIRDTPEKLKAADVYLAGGCDSECLEDFRLVLAHVGIDYTDTEAIF
jgi:hypothetical protein